MQGVKNLLWLIYKVNIKLLSLSGRNCTSQATSGREVEQYTLLAAPEVTI